MTVVDQRFGDVIAVVAKPFDPTVTNSFQMPPHIGGYDPYDYSFDVMGAQTVSAMATEGFTSKPANDPPNQYFQDVLVEPFNIQLQLFDTLEPRGRGQAGGGEMRITDPSGDFDNAAEAYFWDGYPISVWRAHRSAGDDFSQFSKVAEMTCQGITFGQTGKSIRLRDRQQNFYSSELLSKYAGTGGPEGDASLAGAYKLQSYGSVFNVIPTLEDATNRIYGWHDRAVFALDQLLDGGSAWTNDGDVADYAALLASAPAVGHYYTCNALGKFKAGGLPAFSTFRVVGRGDAAGGYVNKRGDIMRRIVTTRSPIPMRDPDDLDTASFTQMNTDQPAIVGFHFNNQVRAGDALDYIMGGCAGWWYTTLLAKLSIGVLKEPAGTPDFVLQFPDDIGFGEPEMQEYQPPRHSTNVGYQHNFGLQTRADLSGVANDDESLRLYGTEWRYGRSVNQSAYYISPYATDPLISGEFESLADAEAEAARQQALFGTRRRRWTFPCRIDPFAQVLGLTCEVRDYPRYNFGAAKRFVVVGIRAVLAQNIAILTLWG